MRMVIAALLAAATQAPAAEQDPGVAVARRVQRHYERIQDFTASNTMTAAHSAPTPSPSALGEGRGEGFEY